MTGGGGGASEPAAARLRIGVLTTSYPRTPDDPAGGFVGGHVRALRALGHEVDVIAAGDNATVAPPEPCVTRIPGALFYRGGAPDLIDRSPLRAAPPAAAFTLRLAAAAAAAARDRAWDAVIAHWLAPSALVALPLGRPLLAIAHGGDVHLLARRRLLAPALRVLAARRARLAFVSPALLDLARAAWPGVGAHAIVQPMAIDGDRAAAIASARATRGSRREAITIVVLARLVPIKAIDVAIDALAALPPRYRLVVAGDGPARATLERHARDRGVVDRVAFRGWLDADARDRLLAEADVLAVPSAPTPDGRVEGTPLAALEALAAGVPLVASAIGGLTALAAHGAVLVPPRDPAALAAALARAATLRPAPIAGLDGAAVGRRLDAHWRRERARTA